MTYTCRIEHREQVSTAHHPNDESSNRRSHGLANVHTRVQPAEDRDSRLTFSAVRRISLNNRHGRGERARQAANSEFQQDDMHRDLVWKPCRSDGDDIAEEEAQRSDGKKWLASVDV